MYIKDEKFEKAFEEIVKIIENIESIDEREKLLELFMCVLIDLIKFWEDPEHENYHGIFECFRTAMDLYPDNSKVLDEMASRLAR